MTRLWTITANAFIQTIRRPIYTILLLVTYGALLMELQLAANSQGYQGVSADDNQLLVNLGLSTLMVTALALAAFSAAGVLTREIESKTMLTVVTKPLGRPVILTGKFLGVLGAVSVGFYLSVLVYLMMVRHGVLTRGADPYDYVVIPLGLGAFGLALLAGLVGNYLFGWSFHTTSTLTSLLTFSVAMVFICLFEKGWRPVPFGSSFNPQLIWVLVLLWMAVVVLTAITVAVSARLGQAATLGVAAGIYLLSLLSEAVFRPAAGENLLARACYWLLPNASYFFAVDQLMLKQTITPGYVGLSALYAACYVAAALLTGIALFQTREVDASPASASAPTLVNLYAWAMRIVAVILGVGGLSVLGGPGRQTVWPWALGALAAAVLAWLWAGLLGRGVRWALHLVVLATAVQVVAALVVVLILHPASFDPLERLLILGLTAAHAAYVLILRLRRATAAHFARRRPGFEGEPVVVA